MSSFLHRYYPIDIQLRHKASYALGAGVFVALFLIYFQPFGTSQNSYAYENLEYTGVGAVVAALIFVSQSLLPIFFSKLFLLESWRTWHQILFNLFTLLFICIGLTLYYLILGAQPNFLSIVKYVFSIGMFPVIGFTLLDESFWLRRKQKELLKAIQPESTSERLQLLQLEGIGSKEKLVVHPEELIYIAASGVYMNIFYFKDSKLQQALLRQTFQNIEQQLADYPQFLRCHRSYLINLQKVKSCKGNTNGLQVTLEHSTQPISVSRQFVSVFQSKSASFLNSNS